MAHNDQYKDSAEGVMIERFDYPKEGELYWDRCSHRVVEAEKDMDEKFASVKRGK